METVYIVDGFLTSEELTVMRAECDDNSFRQDLSALGASVDILEDAVIEEDSPIRTRSEPFLAARRVWSRSPASSNPLIATLLFQKLPGLVRAIHQIPCLSSEQSSPTPIFLFNEHFVVKAPGSGLTFRWHRDCDEQLGALMLHQFPTYTSCWSALDDATGVNGTLAIARSASIVRMKWIDNGADIDAYAGGRSRYFLQDSVTIHPCPASEVTPASEEEAERCGAEELCVSAGAVVLFSSTVWHKSAANISGTTRRIHYSQYSHEEILAPGPASTTASPLCLAIPCCPVDVTCPQIVPSTDGRETTLAEEDELQPSKCSRPS